MKKFIAIAHYPTTPNLTHRKSYKVHKMTDELFWVRNDKGRIERYIRKNFQQKLIEPKGVYMFSETLPTTKKSSPRSNVKQAVIAALKIAEEKKQKQLLFNTNDKEHLKRVMEFDNSKEDFETVFSIIYSFTGRTHPLNALGEQIKEALKEKYPEHF